MFTPSYTRNVPLLSYTRQFPLLNSVLAPPPGADTLNLSATTSKDEVVPSLARRVPPMRPLASTSVIAYA